MTTEKKFIQTPEGQPDKVEMKAEIHRGKMKGHRVTVLLDADDVVREQVGGFIDFVREHAIVGVAIGFVIGTQAQSVVKQLIDSFITPFINLIIGGAALDKRKFYLQIFHNGQDFYWGKMMLVLVNLFVVLVTIYLIVRLFSLDKLDKQK
jgi:large-conductance mechanosensitive channel